MAVSVTEWVSEVPLANSDRAASKRLARRNCIGEALKYFLKLRDKVRIGTPETVARSAKETGFVIWPRRSATEVLRTNI